MALLMTMSLADMASILAAYPVRDLQHLNHVLQRFEAVGADLPTIRRVVQARIDTELSRASRLVKRKPAARDLGLCPHCHAPLSPVITGDSSTILGCRQCRYSTLVEA